MNIFFILKNLGGYSHSSTYYSVLNSVTANGSYGVHLFFVISGFILFLPFAKHYLKNEKKPTLKDYYLRRLTRIEPPYIIVMFLLFLGGLFVLHQYTLSKGLPSLLASLTYSHNFFYGRNTLPLINSVAWSLEVEVQFYILAPFLAKMFVLNRKARRWLIVGIIVLAVILQNLFVLPFYSLYEFIQYFLAGFLLADFYISENNLLKNANSAVVFIFGFFIFCAIWSFRINSNTPIIARIAWDLALPTLILTFYYLVLFTKEWKWIFSRKILTTIGGMCYTIYLIHNPIIWTFDNLPINRKFSNSYLLDWSIHFFIIGLIVLICSSVFFVLVERPCMKRDWFSNLFSNKKA